MCVFLPPDNYTEHTLLEGFGTVGDESHERMILLPFPFGPFLCTQLFRDQIKTAQIPNEVDIMQKRGQMEFVRGFCP